MAGPLISFLTDFGPESAPAVGRGVMWGIAPDARILDLTHTVRKYAVRDGAFLRSRMVGYRPVAVHVAVVDPGVGTARRPIAVRAARGDVLVEPAVDAAAVLAGQPLLYEDADYGGLGIAVNQASAAERFGLDIDTPVRIEPVHG